MKLSHLILFVPLVLFGQTNDMPTSVQEKIYQAKDYYDLSLYVDSKKLLLELLHSDEGKDSEAEIRYQLGLASYYDDNLNDAISFVKSKRDIINPNILLYNELKGL